MQAAFDPYAPVGVDPGLGLTDPVASLLNENGR